MEGVDDTSILHMAREFNAHTPPAKPPRPATNPEQYNKVNFYVRFPNRKRMDSSTIYIYRCKRSYRFIWHPGVSRRTATYVAFI